MRPGLFRFPAATKEKKTMFEEFLDLFERDRKRSGRNSRGDVRGLIDRFVERDDDRRPRQYGDDDRRYSDERDRPFRDDRDRRYAADRPDRHYPGDRRRRDDDYDTDSDSDGCDDRGFGRRSRGRDREFMGWDD
jgi:hypothetical protein